ncbi:PepSY domain-containing protein [Bowmanella dokdonensis]|uniref:PepSY domain-containing protein n=1 Tax=Bowmanella dokdonensis TaxID=751969 RepID=A0A939DQW6_9ALTE|nr:PepSY domain-containing protein [Bowmanella dokdonensis]
MSSKLRQFSRQLHLWLALVIFIPSVIVIVSGILLQVKKQSDWIQPPTHQGKAHTPSISFEHVLAVAQSIPELSVSDWTQIDRLDVRPDKGLIKVLAVNKWEAQIDATSGDVLQVAYRRSDIIEAIHDGSWFADAAKLWVFLPAAIVLFIMWCSGGVLLFTTLKSKYSKNKQRKTRELI